MYVRMALILSVAITLCACDKAPSVQSSAGQGSESSQAFLAAMERGDYETGVAILKQTAAKPDPPVVVLYNLGLAYEKGQGVKQDSQAAANWFKQAAERGDPDSQYNLAILYANGNGVIESASEAKKWYLASATQGFRSAQYNLGVLYATGAGVAKSKELAFMWWNLAASGEGVAKDSAERNMQEITKTMSKDQLKRAKIMVSRCRSSNYQSCE